MKYLILLTIIAVVTSIHVLFDNDNNLTIETDNGQNFTLSRLIGSDSVSDTTGCPSCSGHTADWCTCGTKWCCKNGYTGKYYTCGSNSAACCTGGNANSVGCWVGTGCEICSH